MIHMAIITLGRKHIDGLEVYILFLNVKLEKKKASWPNNVTYNDYKVVWLFHWKGTFPKEIAVTLDFENDVWISQKWRKTRPYAEPNLI